MRWPWARFTGSPLARASKSAPLAISLIGEAARVRALEVLAQTSRHLVLVDSFPHITIEFRAGDALVVDGVDSELERAFVHHLSDTLRMRIALDRAGGNQDPRFIVLAVPDVLISLTATASYRALLAIAETR